MRIVLALLLMLVPAVAVAAGWDHYENARFGYGLDLPEGFVGGGEADNGDGQVFRSTRGGALIRVYGGNVIESSFEDSVAMAMGGAEEAGWSLSYKRVTPTWASFSGTRNGMILYARAIALCGGTQFASFEFEYPQRDLEPMNSVVEHMVRSLKPSGNAIGC